MLWFLFRHTSAATHTHTHKVTVKYLFKTKVSNFQRFLCLMRQHASVAESFGLTAEQSGGKHCAQSAKLLILAYSL